MFVDIDKIYTFVRKLRTNKVNVIKKFYFVNKNAVMLLLFAVSIFFPAQIPTNVNIL